MTAMTRIAHISDTHFGTEQPRVCAALRDALLHESPDLVALTGDVTQRARASQFRAARIFVDSLSPLPVLVLPGNHDIPLFDFVTRLAAPYRNFRRHFGADLAPLWQSGQVAVLGFNSTHRLRHKNGVIAPDDVDAIASRLAAVPQTFKIVALHHPLASATAEDIHNCARGKDAAIDAWTAAGADLFLSGHIHLAYCLAIGRAPHRAVAANAGTAVSHRRRRGMTNSFNLVDLVIGGQHSLRITRLDYDTAGEEFVAAHRWMATRGPAGWTVTDGKMGEPDAAKPY
ncbi:MAG: metallophosphoesterase [Zoogloeaceae bacterium]|nr:metallophosphoesterase [Zoogloeaceae bacterium]